MPKKIAILFLSVAIYSGINIGVGSDLGVDGYDRKGYFLSPNSNCLIVDLSENTIYPKRLLKGESVCLSLSEANSFLASKNADLQFCEVIGECVCEYYYCDKIPVYITVNEYRVNAHIAKRGEEITLGVPFIFGSY